MSEGNFVPHSLLDCGQAFRIAELGKEWVCLTHHFELPILGSTPITLVEENPNRICLVFGYNQTSGFPARVETSTDFTNFGSIFSFLMSETYPIMTFS